ncbi:lisH domain and HEAT repeat-containing protein KIAA1468 homolog isoform X4 [Sorghum bicolor]|uniref:lisH domain and HEAT repeat-containing protein KIAA1468 homolog isoform X4 n=1 Tax=Sorghum bicolor TaxID=4558 RepID=UPI000B424E2D|nr:lisH domain and HEAT repeat-containing protein KIAA1468 homolog isoform X4 [Sorghum bicolor]|eukprot:XP_021312173.1 lisH domain and HEAT repeat-containing protein KIAA1468 homolog isoform X4 [Sorghum bicolor]
MAAVGVGAADERWASLCNCVVNFLLEERYHLTALELMQELQEDGRSAHALRLRAFFSDPALFPPDLVARASSAPPGADPQILLQEKIAAEEKLALVEYDLRLAKEDLSQFKLDLQKQKESSPDDSNGLLLGASIREGSTSQQDKWDTKISALGPLKDNERKDLNCAVKEYLLLAGYRFAAMTFIEEVPDQDLDVWPNSSACVPDALRRYYYQYLSSSAEAAEEKISILQENETLLKDNERLNAENDSLMKSREGANSQVTALRKSLEAAHRDIKDKEKMIQDLRQSLDVQRKELNDCRAEITALKMYIEGTQSNEDSKGSEAVTKKLASAVNITDDTQKDRQVLESSVEGSSISETPVSFTTDENGSYDTSEKDKSASNISSNNVCFQSNLHGASMTGKSQGSSDGISMYLSIEKLESPSKQKCSDKMALETIKIVSDALPKIVPYVLINHREELLPLIICAIEKHPDSDVRDSLTHTLFNLIKRPDGEQRHIIMDACVELAKSIGEMRTETELLPQCWEQINHQYEERRLLVAQSCGELAIYVRPEIRDSLILSIVQQLVEDAAVIVREAATHNLALLLPMFPNLDKYYKVEELMFQLVCDPSGAVVEVALKELVPAVVTWGDKLDQISRVLLAHILASAQRCPPISGVEGTIDSHLRVLGEQERWNIGVLLRMLTELLPFIHQKAIQTCPFASVNPSSTPENFSASCLKSYAAGDSEWSAFEWMHTDCLPNLIKLACLLPVKEDNLRTIITKYLLEVSGLYGKDYLEHIMLPVFLVAAGDIDSGDFTYFPLSIQPKVRGLRPKTSTAEKLAIMCVFPLLLSGILGSPSSRQQLEEYLRKVLIQNTKDGSFSMHHTTEIINAVRFLCLFVEHHSVIFNVLWEMVVSSGTCLKINAAALLRALVCVLYMKDSVIFYAFYDIRFCFNVQVPYTDVKVASTHILPALVTLGSDQNLKVKYASIDAFGAVAQHFKNDMVVDKIRIQMDAFLEDGSHEASISVIRALAVAVPHSTDRLREYLLTKIFNMTSITPVSDDIERRCERANVLCEALRALDATDLPAMGVRDLLLPSIQNLLKDLDALDPAHKEALEIISRERSGGTLESISKVMGAHLGIASSVSSFFGESSLLTKKEGGEEHDPAGPTVPEPNLQAQPESTRFGRIMRSGFGDILRGQSKG